MSFTAIFEDEKEDLKVLTQLEKDGFNSEEIALLLEKSKGVIAGSYPLTCLLQVCESKVPPFVPGDLDIWCHEEPPAELYPSGYKLTKRRPRDLNSQLKKLLAFKDNNLSSREFKMVLRDVKLFEGKGDGDGENYYARLEAHVKAILFLEKKDHPSIQIIVVKTSVYSCIESFDIDVCQVVFDGKKLLKIPTLSLEDIILGKASLTSLACRTQSTSEWNRTCVRILKYAKRGFEIDISAFITEVLEKDKDISHIMYIWNSILTKNLIGFPYDIAHPGLPVFYDGWTVITRGGQVVGPGGRGLKKGEKYLNTVSFGLIKIGDGKITSKTELWKYSKEVSSDYETFVRYRRAVFLTDKFETSKDEARETPGTSETPEDLDDLEDSDA